MDLPPSFPWIPVGVALAPLAVALLVWPGRLRYRHWMALIGIPMAGAAALLFAVQIPRFIYGKADALFLALECTSLLGLVALVVLLRSRLAESPQPTGFYRDALDFLGLARWNPATLFTLVALLVLPLAWIASGSQWLFDWFSSLGRRALAVGDVQSALDSFAVVIQHALMAGIPALFVFHLICRRWVKGCVLPWLLLPILFAGIAIGIVISVTIAHFAH